MMTNRFSIIKYPFLLIIYCLLSSCYLFSQDIEDLPNSPFGSARDCKGSNLVVNCFVSESKKPWTSVEKEEIITKENNGFEWLKKQARSWKQSPISFQQISIGLEQDVLVPEIVHARSIKQINRLKIHWATYALHAAGIKNTYNFYDSLKKKYQVDNIVILVFANKEGRSYAQPTTADFKNEGFVEGAVIYKNYYDNISPLSAATIMHEMLHLYGSWDMYQSDERSYDLQRRVNSAFQNSIMIDTYKGDIKTFNIDQLTSWRIGWTKTYWPWYEMFRQTGTEKQWTTIPGSGKNENE